MKVVPVTILRAKHGGDMKYTVRRFHGSPDGRPAGDIRLDTSHPNVPQRLDARRGPHQRDDFPPIAHEPLRECEAGEPRSSSDDRLHTFAPGNSRLSSLGTNAPLGNKR